MPLWAWCYLGLLVCMMPFGVWLLLKEKWPEWKVACSLLADAALVFAVHAYWHPQSRELFGSWLWILLAASLCWTLYEVPASRGLLDGMINAEGEEGESEAPEEPSMWTVMATGLAFYLPGFIIGLLACLKLSSG